MPSDATTPLRVIDACRASGADVLLDVRVRPGARRAGPGPLRSLPAVDGGPDRTVLTWRVRPAATDGRANAALIRAVADVVGVAPRAVELVRGTTARAKTLRIHGRTPAQVAAALAHELAS
jgi:uncharacterized protein YggU (UPF0235/DUF167 family)